MNRLGWTLFDVALLVRRYAYRGARRQRRDWQWGAAIKLMAAHRQGVWA